MNESVYEAVDRVAMGMNNESISTERIWELLSAKLRSFLLRRVSDEQVAEDLLQETFVRIHKKLAEVEDVQRITPWVFQIARNLVVDHYRRKSLDATAIADDLESQEDEEEHLNELVAGWLPPMVAELPEAYRDAVELYELKGVSQREIADQLGISLSGAKSRVQRGRAQLKKLLFDCCSFEQDRHGNVIGFSKNHPDNDCDEGCEC
jgi:RNA polymerase sigma-70 factor (ECF subfamily)